MNGIHVLLSVLFCAAAARSKRTILTFSFADVRLEHDSNAVQIIFHVRCEILGGNAVGNGKRQFFRSCVDAIEQEYSRRGKLQQQEQQKTTQQNGDIYVPKIPHALPISRMAKDNAFLRDVLIYDEKKKVKPRLSWYDPYDKTWVPNNWFQDGLAADMKYYFGGNEGRCGREWIT